MTKNFKLSELECNCICENPCTIPDDVMNNLKKLAENLQVIRNTIDKPIKVTNAYRCPEKNASVGGATKSQHLLGKAADLQVKGTSPDDVADIVESLQESGIIEMGGVGRYNTFTHVDIRGYTARWNTKK